MRALPLLFIGLLLCASICAHECLYPIIIQTPSYADHDMLLVAHSSNKGGMRHYIWDPETKRLAPALSASLYDPQYIQSLPNCEKFSFIDCGRLRIKEHTKRSAKTLPIDDKKLIESGMLRWISDTECILSAWRYHPAIESNGSIKAHKTLGVYCLSLSGQVTSLVSSSNFNALYPKLIKNDLYYIEESLIKKQQDVVVLQNSERIVLFDLEDSGHGLEILSDTELILYTRHNSPRAPYICYQYSFDGKIWGKKKLFEFIAPSIGINDPYQLFTPLIRDQQIIYINNHDLYCYDLITQTDSILASNSNFSYIGPCSYNEKIYYGRTFTSGDDGFMWCDDERQLYCDLPSYTPQRLVWLGPEAERSEA